MLEAPMVKQNGVTPAVDVSPTSALKPITPRTFPVALKEACFRCKKPVYPTDKIGPLKDGIFFHQGCFKCYICGSRLALKTYCHNRNDIDDEEVYCQNHVPLAGPHDPAPLPRPTTAYNGSGGATPRQTATHMADRGASPASPGGGGAGKKGAGMDDVKIRHALKATAIQKPYPKITHAGAKYQVDFDTQTRLELIHRCEEDDLYREFSEFRNGEDKQFTQETQEEWERALNSLASKFDKHQHHPASTAKEQEELIRHLTIRRERQRDTMYQRRKERERTRTAELVDKQAKEMLELFKIARLESSGQNGAQRGADGDGSGGSSPSTTNGYPTTPPPPFPPPQKKRDVYTDTSFFDAVDQTAISVAQSEQQTFTELIYTLTAHCVTDVEKARAIYRWITVKNLNLMEFNNRLDPNTPMGLLRGIKFGTESYHVLFKRLCSYAGLHCVVIKGFSKSAGYQPGMRFEDSRFRNTWNAVFLNGAWRFVQCNWGARHLVNAKESSGGTSVGGTSGSGTSSTVNGHAQHNGGTHPKDAGATTAAQKTENLRYEYDDHYFMTDAEEFIYEFFPQHAEWQLLRRPITLADFEALPFVRSLFFRYGLSFASAADAGTTAHHNSHQQQPPLRAVVPTDTTGAATVAINMSPDALSTLIFHYNLRLYRNDDDHYQGVALKRFVMQSVVGHSIVFRVHAPCRGELLLDVFANAVSAGEYLTGQPMKFKSVCKFKIVCDQLNVIMVPLPECASGEWGPAKSYRLFGMIPLSHEDAIINAGRELEIRFRMSKPLAEFVATLHNNRHAAADDTRRTHKQVTHSVRGDQVAFRMTFPEEGQYGLDIYTREGSAVGGSGGGDSSRSSGKQLLTHCCKYLINARM